MFLRCIFYVEEWFKVKNINELPIVVLQSWTTKDDSDISVFEARDKDDIKKLNNIAVRLFFENQKLYNSINFLFLKREITDVVPKIVPDSKEKIGCIHGNIPNTKYKDFVNFINYTLHHIKEVITYPSSKIGEIFRNMSNEQFTILLDELDKDRSEKKRIESSVRHYFFRGEENLSPKYLN